MAKDDYYVIVYQVLAYLYRCLKDGEEIDPKLIEPDSKYLNINKKYWAYIMEHMKEQGFIEHITLSFAMGHNLVGYDLSKCQITPKGIEYLCDNSTIKKAYRFLKDAKSIIPLDII